MLKVVIENTPVNVRSGLSQRTNKPYTMREQTALLRGEGIAGPFRITLDDNQEPYTPGDYELDYERSLRFGAYDSLNFRPVLKPLKVATLASMTGTAGR